jgi:allantoinase
MLKDAPVTVETCPHYLTFAAEDIPYGAVQYKCAPPIRERENRERLWEALRTGQITMVVSDHSPAPPELKKGDFLQAWGGISSLQLGLPAVWTEARKRGFTLADVARWMSTNPAQLAGLDQKGGIAIGKDADLVLFDPEATFIVDAQKLHHRHKATPYDGMTLYGTILSYCPTNSSPTTAGL